MRLTAGQRDVLIRFLTNAGTIALGGMVVGPLISLGPFRVRLFTTGTLIYTIVLWLALQLSRNGRDI